MTIFIEKKFEIHDQEQVDLAAENIAQILVQQVMSRKSGQINKRIENKYGKSS